MSAWKFACSHALVLVPLTLVCGVVGLVLVASGVTRDTTFLVCLCMVGAVVATMAARYLRIREFYAQMDELTHELDNPRLVPSMLEEPNFVEGQVAYDALEAMAKSTSDEVAEYRRQVDDYRAYVETWVHEAKSPLAAAHLALENLALDPDAVARDPSRLEALGDELRRVEGYIEQALFYARSESVEQDYLIRRYRLRDLVGAALKANAHELIEAHVAPRLGEGLDLEVFADEKWLVFILGQLVQNSVRYVREDAEPSISFSARLLDAGGAEERVELEVRDNGCGCGEADLVRVFERGFTGENGRTHKRSTGLGLWLVRRLCDKMGLTVSADSAEGEWFAVRIAFPTNKMHYFDPA